MLQATQNTKLIDIKSGAANCDHCGTKIKILCCIEKDGAPMTIGSSCIYKFIPELSGSVKLGLKKFNRARKRAKQEENFRASVEKTRLDFKAALELNPANKKAVEFIENYQGQSTFFNSLKFNLSRWGRLTEPQITAVKQHFAREEAAKLAPEFIPVNDGLITIGKGFALKLHEKKINGIDTGIDSAHFNFKVTKIFKQTPRAIELELTGTGRPTSRCCKCGAPLSDPQSIENGIGPVCGKRHNVFNWKMLDNGLQATVKTFRAWVPLSVIKERIGF